jgi:hypothetical protein
LKNIFFEKLSDHSEFFFYFSIHKKLNGQKKIRITFVSEKKNW